MCTVGSVIDPTTGRIITFKQCDLPHRRLFFEPHVTDRPGHLRFVAFEREGSGGPWAGINERGVAFVSADAYLESGAADNIDPNGDVFEGYAHIIARCHSAADAVEYMRDFYEERGGPDILVVSDMEGAFLMEYSPYHGTRIAHHDSGIVVATNHFRMLPDAIDFDDNHSTYLRLARAEEILERDASLRGIHTLLADQHFGATELSICRVAASPDEHLTQAAVIFSLEAGRVDCSYVLNGNPREKPFRDWSDVFEVDSE
jgi:hypothetical protein